MSNLKVVETEVASPLERLVDEYLIHCRARRLSKRTIEQVYRPVLRRTFLRWAREAGLTEIGHVDKRAMDRFQVELLDEPGPSGRTLSPASVHSYTRTVNSFLTWAKKEGEQVAVQAQLPRLPKKVIDVLSRKEIDAMEEAADSERDRLIIRILADTGIRVGELCKLLVSDLVDKDRFYLRIAGPSQGGGAKGDRDRLVPITPTLYRRTTRYIARNRPSDADSRRLFVSLKRRPNGEYIPLEPSGVQQMVRNLADKADVSTEERRVYPHLFRHSFITHALVKGMNPVVLARVVGHERLDLINSVYSHIASTDASDAMLALLTED